MALSTFFTGLSIQANRPSDKWLKRLMMLHGIFFISCFVLPMTGLFTPMATGETGSVFCVCFFPICVLAYQHFGHTNPSIPADRGDFALE